MSERKIQKLVDGESRYNLRSKRNEDSAKAPPGEHKVNAALLSAAKKGNKETVLSLLSSGADVDFRDNGGNTPLMAAVKSDDITLVETLLRWGSSVNAQNKRKKQSSVHISVETGHTQIVKVLLESQADCNLMDQAGETPLVMAVRGEKPQIAKMILQQTDCDVNVFSKKSASALWWAVDQGDSHMVQLLLGSGADPNLPKDTESSPLLRAVQAGHQSIAKMLLSVGADPIPQTPDGTSLCDLAESNDMQELVSTLKKLSCTN